MQVPPNTKIYATYRLDDEGFRGPFTNPVDSKSAKKVVLIGGASEGFGFGLNEDQTLAASAARSARNPVNIQLSAFPGATAAMS